MADLLIILHQYTEIITGQRKNYSDIFSDTKDRAEVAAGFLRLAAETYLGCRSYAAARATITPQLITRMKLDKIAGMIKPPVGTKKEDKWDYVLARTFTKNFDDETWMNDLYYRKLKAVKEKKLTGADLPKGYLTPQSGAGRGRVSYMVWLILKNDYPMMSIEEAYRFSEKDEFMQDVIIGYGLESAYKKSFKNPVELLHSALPEDARNEALMERCVSDYEDGFAGEDDWF